jgi:hypothetical protein
MAVSELSPFVIDQLRPVSTELANALYQPHATHPHDEK